MNASVVHSTSTVIQKKDEVGSPLPALFFTLRLATRGYPCDHHKDLDFNEK